MAEWRFLGAFLWLAWFNLRSCRFFVGEIREAGSRYLGGLSEVYGLHWYLGGEDLFPI